MELSFIDPVSYGFSLHAKYSQIDFGMYAAFVGMGPSTFSAASVPGYTAITLLRNGTKQEQGAGSVDLEARLVLGSLWVVSCGTIHPHLTVSCENLLFGI